MLALVALLSLGIASASLAQDAGGKAPAADQGAKAPKKHKKQHSKKHKKSNKKKEGADEMPK